MEAHPRGTGQHADLQQRKRSAVATPLDESAVHVVMRTDGQLQEGPWSFITDLPNTRREMLGPPPIYLALAGWAT